MDRGKPARVFEEASTTVAKRSRVGVKQHRMEFFLEFVEGGRARVWTNLNARIRDGRAIGEELPVPLG